MNWTPKTVAITGAVVVLGAWYLKRQAGQALADAGQAVNPTNHDNVFNRGFNGLYQSVTGSGGTLGTDLADWINGGD